MTGGLSNDVTHLAFQLTDLSAQRRLCDPQANGGPLEAASYPATGEALPAEPATARGDTMTAYAAGRRVE